MDFPYVLQYDKIAVLEINAKIGRKVMDEHMGKNIETLIISHYNNLHYTDLCERVFEIIRNGNIKHIIFHLCITTVSLHKFLEFTKNYRIRSVNFINTSLINFELEYIIANFDKFKIDKFYFGINEIEGFLDYAKEIYRLCFDRQNRKLTLLLVQRRKFAEKDYLFPPRWVILMICDFM